MTDEQRILELENFLKEAFCIDTINFKYMKKLIEKIKAKFSRKPLLVIIEKLYKKWDDWENEEKVLIFGERVIHTNNYTIQLFIIIFLLLMSIIFY
ncbi:hypothetical protein M0Q97_02870 [Candidatus Dojkabacteria bacterium]|jgi:hypothetical protein|nr:hypothetical protein [Candidatus Dojkabacteria bacterium]